MAKVLLLFCDGIGVGQNDPLVNPFARQRSPWLPFYYSDGEQRILPYKGVFRPIKADMGMPGLPQSATGQTALFCGVNSARIVGRHISGLPTPTLRKLIDRYSIFINLKRLGKKATFINALSEDYFERLGERISATTRAQQAGGYAPRMLDDLRAKRAISHDLTNAFLRARGYNVPLFTVAESAEIVRNVVDEVEFCLFEFLLSDQVGHSQDSVHALVVIELLDTFLTALIPQLDLQETTVFLTSDHGNMEDLGVKTHTRNLVPLCIWGPQAERIAASVRGIEDIAGSILHLFGETSKR